MRNFKALSRKNNKRGFTLVELMIVVAIIAILVTIAFPFFSKTTRKARASEVPAMFSKIKIKQGQYQSENGVYLSTGAGETDYFPATPAGGDRPQDVGTLPDTWTQLRLQPDDNTLYCSYVTIAGERGDDANIGPVAQGFGFTQAPDDNNWFYIIAECDFDDNSAVNSLYFTSSEMSGHATQNDGR